MSNRILNSKFIKISIILIVLFVESHLLINILDKYIYSQQQNKDKFIIFLKVLIEITIVFLIIYYSADILSKNVFPEIDICNDIMNYVLTIFFTFFILQNLTTCQKIQQLTKYIKEDYINYQRINKDWTNFPDSDYIFDKPTQKYWDSLEKPVQEKEFEVDYTKPFSKTFYKHRGPQELEIDKYRFSALYPKAEKDSNYVDVEIRNN